MGNEQKPSLFLVGNHLKFEQPGIPFTEKMLTWPIMSFTDPSEPCANIERNTIVRNVLGALTKLSPFLIKISITATVEKEQLFYEFRSWGKIFLNEENVLTFSHYSTEENKPFSNLEDWVEGRRYVNEQEKLVALAKWSVEDWINFFKKKILARSTHLQNKADNKREDAKKLEDSANLILKAVNSVDLNIT